MPIFEYLCSVCGEQTERIFPSPAVEIACPKCGGAAQRRVSVFAPSTPGNTGGCAAPGGSGFS